MRNVNQGEAYFRRDVERHALETNSAIADCILRLDNQGVFNVKDYRAIGDGVADDTASIQAAVDAAAVDGGVVLVPPGVYRINPDHAAGYSVRMASNVTLHISAGATLQAIPNSLSVSSVVYAINVQRIAIVGLGTIDGNRSEHIGSSGESGMGIICYGCDDVTIQGVRCINCWGDGVYIGINGSTPCTNVRMSGVSCVNNRRNGCSVVALHGGTIDHCTFEGTNGTAPQAGIDLETNVSGAIDAVIVSHCLSVDNYGTGMTLTASSKNCSLRDNYVARCLQGGIHLTATGHGNTVSGNIVADLTSGIEGAYFVGAASVNGRLIGNEARNIETGYPGFYVHPSATATELYQNKVDGLSLTAAAAYAFQVLAPGTTLIDNRVVDVGSIGIFVTDNAHRCQVLNNTVLRAVGRGFYIGGNGTQAIGNSAIDITSVSPSMFQFPVTVGQVIGNRAILTTTDTAVVPFAYGGAPRYKAGNVGIGTQTYTEVIPVALLPYLSTAYALMNLTASAGAITGTDQYGLVADLISGTDATDNSTGVYARTRTTAGSFTQTQATGVYADAITAGAGSTITTAIGVFCAAQTAGTTNWGLYLANGAHAFFGGNIVMVAPGNYTDDTAAASGGVAVGEVYRNGSVLQIRVS